MVDRSVAAQETMDQAQQAPFPTGPFPTSTTTTPIPTHPSALTGYNGTIFAYGQTGSGKTFTITGGAERYDDRGIIPRVLTYLFKHYAEVAAGRGHPPPAGACPISPTSRGSLRPSPSGRPFPSP